MATTLKTGTFYVWGQSTYAYFKVNYTISYSGTTLTLQMDPEEVRDKNNPDTAPITNGLAYVTPEYDGDEADEARTGSNSLFNSASNKYIRFGGYNGGSPDYGSIGFRWSDFKRDTHLITLTLSREDGASGYAYLNSSLETTENKTLTISWDTPNVNPTASVSVSNVGAGKSAGISWKYSDADGDSVSLVSLARYYQAAGASSWIRTVLTTTSYLTSYTDAIPASYDGGMVYYEVQFRDNYGSTQTAVSGTYSVILNTAPTAPGNPIIPAEIFGGSTIRISWDASTDAQNNLAGYKLERSVDSGSSWEQVYQGSAAECTNTVLYGTESVMYRVKAYDTYGLESGYASSSRVTVTNNNAPYAPPSVTAPASAVAGRDFVVSWTAAADPDGDPVSYRLERSVDGGSAWEQVYQGTSLLYTDTISAEWASVQYRVTAVDIHGAESVYTASPERAVVTNFAPVIVLDDPPESMNWGIISEAPSVSFTATDEDGTEMTYAYKVDGHTWKSGPIASGGSGVFDFTDASGASFWMQILNGTHTAVIEVSDGKETVSAAIGFTKKVTECAVTLAEPMNANERIQVCVISVNGFLPADSMLLVEVTNNALDDQPVWEDATAHALAGMNHAFVNTAAAKGWAFNFRVTAMEGASGEGGYITSVQGAFQ